MNETDKDPPRTARGGHIGYAVIVAIVGGSAFAFAWAGGWLPSTGISPERMVDRTQGDQPTRFPGYRRAHAKGICATGRLVANGKLADLSVAQLFAKDAATPIVGRFSLALGDPSAPDLSAPVRSLALMLTTAQGQQWRTAMNTPPLHPVRRVEDVYAQFASFTPDPRTGKPDPARIKAFDDAHPESAPSRAWARSYRPTSSLATERYHSVNAFYLVDRDGARRAVRWAAIPLASPRPQVATGPDNVLEAEIAARVRQTPIRFMLQFMLAAPGDDPNDPTRPWPKQTLVDAGIIELTAIQPQAGGACDGINFDPTILPRGIATTDDPILAARSGAYAESYRRRATETLNGKP